MDAKKKIDIWKLPPVLVVHLKRFEFSGKTKRFRKIQVDVTSPLTVELSDVVKERGTRPLVYKIVCVANHSGAYGSGHYTATCRHPITGKFYHFNDERVEEVDSLENVLTQEAYVLFLLHDVEASEQVKQQQSAGRGCDEELPPPSSLSAQASSDFQEVRCPSPQRSNGTRGAAGRSSKTRGRSRPARNSKSDGLSRGQPLVDANVASAGNQDGPEGKAAQQGHIPRCLALERVDADRYVRPPASASPPRSIPRPQRPFPLPLSSTSGSELSERSDLPPSRVSL
jgi:hypothetical protein